MYEDKKKSKRVYVESKCVSRDDCCWDQTSQTDIVLVNWEDMPKASTTLNGEGR
jgi:hypothetical protein